jgi:LPXTG-site transpeptidase (sortase) family protein
MAQNDPFAAKKSPRWERYSLALLGVGIAALIAAGVLFAMSLMDDGQNWSGPGTTTALGDPNAPLTPVATATAAQQASSAPIARLQIPKYSVDAPVIVLGLDEEGVMEAPDGPVDVAWYEFTAHPGTGSNAVFSGHVDWTFENGPAGAVFWNLKNMVIGDIVKVRLEDGTEYEYSVISREQVDPDTVDVQAVVGSTQQEIITMITCGGTFDSSAGHYTNRVIVKAKRVSGDQPASATAQ